MPSSIPSPSPSPLIGRDPFAKAVAASFPELYELLHEQGTPAKKQNPQWKQLGLKLIEVARGLEHVLDEQIQQEAFAQLAQTPKKPARGKHDADFLHTFVANRKGDRVEKQTPKRKGEHRRGQLKWAGMKTSKGFGGSNKHGQQMFNEDEEDEEDLPVARVKTEDGVKVE